MVIALLEADQLTVCRHVLTRLWVELRDRTCNLVSLRLVLALGGSFESCALDLVCLDLEIIELALVIFILVG